MTKADQKDIATEKEVGQSMTIVREITDEKRHGQHYTPTELADFLAERSFAALALDTESLTVIDPACGDGELLLAAANIASSTGYSGSLNLIGYELDETAVIAANRRLDAAGVRAEIILGDFLVHQRNMSSGTVDLIITNPPYVRTQHLGQEAARLLANEFSLTGRVDLTHPFVSVASRLLSKDGTLGLLCSNRFLTTLSGENVRRTLMNSGLQVGELYDLGDTKLFKAAVLPAIIVASKTSPTGHPPKYVSAYEASSSKGNVSLFDALRTSESSMAFHNGKDYEVKVGSFVPPTDTKTPWRLSDPESDQWLETIKEHTWKTFGDIAKIRVGIKTTADRVFLGDDWERSAPDVEDELLLPLITQNNITPWRTSDSLEMKVLYPYNLSSNKRQVLDLEDWPGTKAYLLTHEEQLQGRKYVIEGGRKWYEIWVPQRPALWAEPKIVFPDISENPRFALDTTGAVVNGNCYWISLADFENEDIAYLMLAVANSSLGLRYYDEVCGNRLYSGKRRWITQYVRRLPLPSPDTAESKKLIAEARALTAGGEAGGEQFKQLDSDVAAAFVASPPFGSTDELTPAEETLF
ncbi:N-6 DNA methylase [Brevibacterium aurantiacum]|uniref:N-6 DNA methylase n=1 Tax=Brevibacterium aurantiacum TaxID=273384 RepID=UPI001C6A79D6|nr:N-6 DNA methylase [Brevibacterium aurantiacum]